MKYFLTILLIHALAMIAFAQNDSTELPKRVSVHKHAHYLSVNGTFFLQQFFNFTTSTTTITPSPYIVEYRYQPGHHGFRIDAGGTFSQKKSFLDSSQVQITKSSAFNFRVGYVYAKKLSEHWSIFTGADVISVISTSFLRNNTVEDIVTTTNNAYTIGFGPALGIQFAINKRIGLFTETAFYYQYVFSKQATGSLNFPEELNSTTSSGENDLRFLIPVSLFFYVKI